MNKDLIICKQVATESVAIFADKLKKRLTEEEFIILSDKLTKWIFSKGSNKDNLISRQAALRRAVMAVDVRDINTSDKLLEFAETLNTYYNK